MFFFLVALALVAVVAVMPMIAVETRGIEYKDLVSIQLTALTLVVAALGVGVAFLAVWGYKEFMERAKDSAREAASEVAKNTVSSHLKGDSFVNEVRAALDQLYEEHAARRTQPPTEPQGAEDGRGDDIPRLPHD
jgi:hypothetical protein